MRAAKAVTLANGSKIVISVSSHTFSLLVFYLIQYHDQFPIDISKYVGVDFAEKSLDAFVERLRSMDYRDKISKLISIDLNKQSLSESTLRVKSGDWLCKIISHLLFN